MFQAENAPLDRISQREDPFHLRIIFPDPTGGGFPIHVDRARFAHRAMLRLRLKVRVILFVIGVLSFAIEEVQAPCASSACRSADAAAKTNPTPTSRPSASRQLQNQRASFVHRLTQIFTDSAITDSAFSFCHSDRSGGISNYFCFMTAGQHGNIQRCLDFARHDKKTGAWYKRLYN